MPFHNRIFMDTDLKTRVYSSDFEARVSQAVNSFLENVEQMLIEEQFDYHMLQVFPQFSKNGILPSA